MTTSTDTTTDYPRDAITQAAEQVIDAADGRAALAAKTSLEKLTVNWRTARMLDRLGPFEIYTAEGETTERIRRQLAELPVLDGSEKARDNAQAVAEAEDDEDRYGYDADRDETGRIERAEELAGYADDGSKLDEKAAQDAAAFAAYHSAGNYKKAAKQLGVSDFTVRARVKRHLARVAPDTAV